MIPLGLCQCGCGERTEIAKRNQNWGLFVRKGEPYRFVRGHHMRLPESREAVGERNAKADSVLASTGRDRARRFFPFPSWCDDCRAVPPRDRHHKDGDPLNNEPSNIAFLCRRCHMRADGRILRLPSFSKGRPTDAPRDLAGRYAK